MCRYPHSAQPASHRLRINNALKHLFNNAFIVPMFWNEWSMKIDYIECKWS
jgi:hypothetical protein